MRNSASLKLAETKSIELLLTEDDLDLLDRAATALETDGNSFRLAEGRLAAQRLLASRGRFSLDPLRAWCDCWKVPRC